MPEDVNALLNDVLTLRWKMTRAIHYGVKRFLLIPHLALPD